MSTTETAETAAQIARQIVGIHMGDGHPFGDVMTEKWTEALATALQAARREGMEAVAATMRAVVADQEAEYERRHAEACAERGVLDYVTLQISERWCGFGQLKSYILAAFDPAHPYAAAIRSTGEHITYRSEQTARIATLEGENARLLRLLGGPCGECDGGGEVGDGHSYPRMCQSCGGTGVANVARLRDAENALGDIGQRCAMAHAAFTARELEIGDGSQRRIAEAFGALNKIALAALAQQGGDGHV